MGGAVASGRMTMTWRRAAAVLVLLVGIGACRTPADPAAPTPAPDATTAGPVIEVDTTGDPPTSLTVIDLTDGEGAVAAEGDVVRVSYVGRGWRTGIEFGAWASPLYEFRIGADEVVEGFERGVDGMAEGGRRQIVVPPDLAYGGADLGALTGDTLVFVVELVEVVPGADER